MSNNPMLVKFRQSFPVIIIGLVTVALVAIVGLEIKSRTDTMQVTIAAGSPSNEAFTLMQALKAVTEKYYPRYKFLVLETSGTAENMQKLEKGEAQLVTAQADGLASPNARTVAVLYNDIFQILAHKDAKIQQFVDLKNKRIAVPKAGGQYDTFLFIANHYGMSEVDFRLLGPNDESAALAYVKNDADVIFRVRALPSASTTRLAAIGNTMMVPIDQAAALNLEFPALSMVTIPKGACLGNPPVPEVDITSISAPRFLVAHRNTDYDLVSSVARVLMERRQDLIAAISDTQADIRPLAANAQPPNPRVGLGSSIHPAATDYYNRNEAPFIARFADWIGAAIGILVLIVLWVWAVRQRKRNIRITKAAEYHKKAAALIKEAQIARTKRELQLVQKDLVSLLPRALGDLEEQHLSEGDVRTIRSLADFGIGIAGERMGGSETADYNPATEGAAASDSGKEASASRWGFWKRP